MYKLTNLLLKLFVLLAVAVGGINSAWADRVAPQIVSVFNSDVESDRTTWCYIHFVNGNGGYVYCAADGNNLAFSNSKRANYDNFWALIGTREDFVLRNHNGLYAKLQGDKYVGTSVEAEATHCTYTENTNGNTYWNLHRLNASAGLNWNPQTQIKEWSGNGDGGSRMEFVPVSKEEWLEMTYSNLHVLQYSSAPSGSEWAADTRWYTIKNYRSNNYLANCAGYTDASGNLKTRGSGTIAEGTDQWCFVKDANDKVTIYNKAAGTGQVLGSTTNLAASNQLTKLYDKDAAVANVSKLYTIGDNNSGFYVKIDGLNNGYWDDNTSSGLLKTWEVAQAATSDGGRFIVTEVIPEGYQLIIEGDNANNYAVTYSGNTYHHGDIMPMSIDDVDLHDLRDFSIDCSGKFVYGPVIKKGSKTVTYTIKDMVSSVNDLTTGFYQFQLFDDSNSKVNNVNTRINGSSGNINTKANTIYVMPYKDVPTGNDQNLAKYSGVPTYANEASTFFYIEKNGNNLQLQSVNGHYAVNDSRERPNATRTASPVTSGYAFPDGQHLQFTGWVIQNLWTSTSATGVEGPRVAYNGNQNYEKYNAAKVDQNLYSIYKVVIENATDATDIANDPNVVVAEGSTAETNNRGLCKVYRNGYLFFERGYEPTATDFTLHGTTYDSNFSITIGEDVNGIRTITFSQTQSALPFRVIITGDKKDDEVITYHNHHRFRTTQTSMLIDGAPTSVKNGEEFLFKMETTRNSLLDCDFSSHADSRTNGTSFIYGPVIDWEARTITCEIREAITELPQTGWYQLKWDVSTDNNVTKENRYTNAREDSYTNNTRDQNRFYVTMPKEGISGRSEYMSFNVRPTDDTAPLTFVKLVRSGNNVMMMSIDGRYLNETATPSTTGSGYANPVTYVNGELDFRHWFPFNNYSYMVGKATDTHNYFYTTPAKFDHANLDFYEVFFYYQGNESQLVNGRSITYRGSATNYSMPTVYSGGYLVFPKGTMITISDFDVNNTNAADIISKTIDKDSHKIKIELRLPMILHRRAYFYDKYNTVSADKRPANSSYVGKEYPDDTADADKGFVMNGSTKIQKTAEYRIPIYIAPGSSRQMYMPTDKLAYYQRWYDYKTETLVNQGVMPDLYSSNFKTYSNGHVAGKVASGIHGFWQSDITMHFPTTLAKDADHPEFYEDYIVGVDVSRFKDNSTNNATGDLTEPTLSQRVLFEIKDANRIATELTACVDNDNWLESRNIIFPTIKRGSTARNTDKDALPIDMDMNNYWVYDASHQLVQLTEPSQISVRVDDNTANISASLMPSIGSTTGWGGVNFSQSHFISFSYPGEGAVRTVPDNSHATVKVYFVEGGKEYQLAKFELTFVPNTDPKIITEVIGRQENGEYKSQRSPYWLEENFGRPVAELTFDNKNILMKDHLPAGGVDNAGGTDIGTYLFPLDFNLTNYAYGYEKGDGTARGEYTIANARHIPGQANFRFKPVQHYYDVLNGTSKEANNDQFYLYVDASDQPGEVMSLQINEHLCEGTRLYVSGWMTVTSYSSNPASVLLNLVAKNSTNGNSKILTSYCPGMLHTYMFDEQGNEVAKMDNTTGEASSNIVVNTQYWGLWSQLSFSFLLSSDVAKNYDTFQVQVLNNCYNSSGGDYLLDNFQIFANPPRGNVDFTTPLCSDKVRHAKVHADYDMLKDLSADGVNDVGNDATWDIAASYSFIDAEMFDNYQVPAELGEDLTVKDLFVEDDKGNHNLKSEYASDKVYEVINKAFDAAMVGRRCAKEKTNAEGNKYEDYGFHSFNIDKDYEQIPVYAYNDSKNDVVYRETNGDIRRIVFKEDVARGEMSKLTDESDNNREYYPHMRPSRTYYLVFAPYVVTEKSLRDEHGNIKDDIATDIFGVHQTCSYFGKFTTKDPMHVILDNADIEADLPMKAICHGESAEFQFDMPALKADKPIYDEEYCTSDHGLDDRIVPSTMGTHHYHYQTVFDNNAVQGVIKNLPYDWWLGGTLGGKNFGGRIEDYNKATHPTYTYNQPEDIAHKKHGDPVNLAQAMIDFRFYYPDFGMDKTDIYGVSSLTDADWAEVKVQPYNNDTGYGLLQSEINTIKDFVTRGLIVLHRNTFDMPLTLEKSDELTLAELTDMTESELSNQILELAIQLEDEQLKALESSVLNPDRISKEGRVALSFEVFYTLDEAELRGIAPYVLTALTTDDIAAMTETELRKAIEDALKKLSPDAMLTIAENNFPNLKHEERAYLVIRALNVMSREALVDLEEDQRNDNDFTRQLLREKMIAVFADLPEAYLLDMWNDAVLKLPAEDVAQMLNGETAEDMDAQGLATLVEGVLARITNNIVSELNADRFIHFTLVPIMPSQENFVDEPYIFCPDPRGVKIRVTTNSPRMLDGFADMPYPDDMDNVPVRLGLSQIAAVPYSDAQEAKTLRVPLRKLGSAQKNGTHEMHLQGSGYVDNLYLVETNDPDYQYGTPEAGTMKPAILVEGGKPGDQDAYRLVAKVKQLQAVYTSNNNFMDLQFDPTMKFREGYTYRLGFNFMEFDQENAPTISCYGTMFFDMKIVPEYQKWTGAVSDDWTNDANWQRADRSDLHADSDDASVSVALADATDIRDAGLYATNDANNTSESFIPMAFTNTLIAEDADRMPQLYSLIAPQRGRTEMVNEKEVVVPGHFLGGSDPSAAGALLSSASDKAKYDMEVYDATGAWHTADNYECGLFGTYVTKGITFEPATSLYNAQLLSYQKAWVEYSLNTNRWYTIASPLQGTFSGEWYSPTGSGDDKGKQLTPHFYGITYKTALNNRFNPAYYQRSWDQGTAKMFRCYDTNHNPEDFYMSDVENKSPLNVALALDWSHVYNDVKVNYSNGGFSVKPVFDDDSDGEVLVRMPKADDSYLYFDKGDETDQNTHRGDETPIARTGHYRLFSDKLATAESFSQSVTNANGAENPYYLVANPFMAPMDMDKFFTANPQFEAGKYWIMTDNLQSVNVKTGSGWFSTTGDNAVGTVAPLQAFFVKRVVKEYDSNDKPIYAATPIEVNYTAAMQKALATVPALKAPAQQSSSSMVFHIEATNADGALQSQAAVAFSETATNAYRAGEDAELLLDGNTAEEIATVFTAAPTAEMGEAQAMQFNVLSRSVTMIPLGVIAPTDETETTLTFTGLAALADVMAEVPYLYDAANGTFTVLDEEDTLTVTGTSAGRYFIVSGMTLPYGNDDANGNVENGDLYNLHGIRVATPQRGNVTIRGSRKEYRR